MGWKKISMVSCPLTEAPSLLAPLLSLRPQVKELRGASSGREGSCQVWHEMAHVPDALQRQAPVFGKLVSERGDEALANSITKIHKRPGGAEISSEDETAQGQVLGQVLVKCLSLASHRGEGGMELNVSQR